MTILLTGRTDSYAQFITVLVVFVLVLGVTALVTRWIANYQKQQSANMNIEVIETTVISNGKYIQIVRVGETYMVIAVCKDTVTMLGEIPAEQLNLGKCGQEAYSGGVNSRGTGSLHANFRDFLNKAVKKAETESNEAGDNQSDDEV